MGLRRTISRLGRWFGNHRFDDAHSSARRVRICRFEEVEGRRMMTVAPIHVGSVYYEQASGDDLQPNLIEFTFQGGAAGTQLTQIIIDGDKDGKGISSGDIFFDTAPGGYGVFRSNPLKILESNGFQVVSTQVVDGGSKLILNLSGFDAGEKLLISIDVDEFQFVEGNDIDINAVAEGGEFQRSHFITSFIAPHYEDAVGAVQFWDAFNQNFATAKASAGTTLNLPDDRYSPSVDLSDMTAGAVNLIRQKALPNSIAGVVYLDHNLSNTQDANDTGIAGVNLTLEVWNGSSYVASGKTTVTDANGAYKFDNLDIGKFRVVETQPAGYGSVGSTPGKVNGQTRGVTVNSDVLAEIELRGGEFSIRNDFAEYLPVSIGGKVHINNTGDCENPENPPLAGVTIELLDVTGKVIATTVTGADGKYQFSNLKPGTYGVHEIQPIGYFSGATFVGSSGGTKSDDLITQVVLTSGVNAVNYDFCEIPPASLSGFVYVDTNNNGIKEAGEAPIAGVTIVLKDAAGNPTGATATTNASGYYQFTGLRPGTYGVDEQQPSGYIDGLDTPGNAGGSAQNPGDRISGAVLIGGTVGVNYNFGELLPVSISGRVDVNTTGDCENPENPPLPGVIIQLLNSQGQVIATTTTDANGMYYFTDLPPGTYGVHEIQPIGYFNGGTFVGSEGGDKIPDQITNIVLVSGTNAVQYNFCEIPPAKLCGFVYVDMNDNGLMDTGEAGIGGVTLYLLDANGVPTGQSVVTRADGAYCFVELPPGTYGVTEVQPPGYFDGKDTPGTKGGTAVGPDSILNVVLPPGVHGEFYNFGELPPASISGRVDVNTTGDCENPANPPLPGVTILLLDVNGNVIGTTTTDANGMYYFENLAPGTYTVQEIQPTQYFNGGTFAGSVGGAVIPNQISNVVLVAGVHAVKYNFCEIPPAKLSGHVFQDGPAIPVENAGDVPDVLSLRDGKLTPDDTLLAGVVLQLRDGVTGLPIYGSTSIAGIYSADQPITTVTNAGGYYEFVGLPPGSYAVYEVRPGGYYAGINTPGTEGGVVISPLISTDPNVLDPIQDMPIDAIMRIELGVNEHSMNNNFSVVITVAPQPIILPLNIPAPEPPALPGFFPLAPPELPYSPFNTPFYILPQLTRTGGQLYTWHLSVVDAGYPRGIVPGDSAVQFTSMKPGDDVPWNKEPMDEVEWELTDADGKSLVRKIRFGMKGGIPVSGDFNGDGKCEVGVFKDGYWYIDLNDNGSWDEGDLWAKLGHDGDLPVAGDWDGDGKTDIGIYGPAWKNDPRAIRHEPGMPDPHNENFGLHKNIPRVPDKNAHGERKLKLTAQGKQRSDLIDHVFLYGTPGDHPLVGDWNGDGIDTIGVFRDGTWRRDTDGDGKFSKHDVTSRFGQAGDIPLVADFDGDGIEELAIFRDGTFYIDSNNNGYIDPTDKVVQLGKAGDTPIVGDWDGDGKAELGVFHDQGAMRTARKP